MNENVAERNFAAKLQAHHNHPRDPEENNIVAGDERRRGIKFFEFGRFDGPAHSRERPERAAEPRVQNVFVLMNIFAVAVRTFLNVAFGNGGAAAVGAVPGGNSVSPPQLAAYAPVADIFEPVDVDFAEAVGNEFGVAIFDSGDSWRGESFHFHEPLTADKRLNGRTAARTVPDGVFMIFRGN